MIELLEQVKLTEEQERKFPTERAKKYMKIMILENEILSEKESIYNELSQEEMDSIENYAKESYPVPKYLTVREVSMLTGLSKQMVRRHCVNKNFKGYQASGENGTWSVETEQFLSHPNWNEFIQQRNEMFNRSKKVAELAINLWDTEEIEEETDAK
ncbi:hypothetical protein [Bacillus cereus]|uniref:hypothetical protein n=1 Tax=Bacillus cereus TaxID=1396 RepID=UPI000BEDB2E8|nr:hypothetical protein [Bacillus cereus]PEA01905.1 hypothetical protein CON37_25330 [Bacillus cereus]